MKKEPIEKNDILDKISALIYRKNTLEIVIINLSAFKKKVDRTKKPTIEKIKEYIAETITNANLKQIFMAELEAGNFDVFQTQTITSLLAKLNDIAAIGTVIDLSLPLPLTDTDLREIVDQLEEKLHTKIILDLKIDPSLLGGIVIKKDNYIFDASLKNHLKNYENEWVKSLHKAHKI